MTIDEMMEENVAMKKRVSFLEDLLNVWKQEDEVRKSKYKNSIQLRRL